MIISSHIFILFMVFNQMNDHGNLFINIVRICLVDSLTECLTPFKYKFVNEKHIYLCKDLNNLRQCDRFLRSIVDDKILKIVRFSLSTIVSWDSKERNRVQKLFVDNDFIDLTVFNNQSVLRYDIMPKNLKHITFDYRFNQPLEVNLLPSTITQIDFTMY